MANGAVPSVFNLQEREREPDDGEGVVFSLENLNLKTEHERGTRSRSRRVFLLVVLFSRAAGRRHAFNYYYFHFQVREADDPRLNYEVPGLGAMRTG